MLRNVGHTIKIIAYIVLIIALIAIVLGVVGCFTAKGPAQQAQQWTIFLLAIVYAVSAVVLYGFGQLIETNQRNAETNAEILALLKENLAKAEQGKTQTSTGPDLVSSITQHSVQGKTQTSTGPDYVSSITQHSTADQ